MASIADSLRAQHKVGFFTPLYIEKGGFGNAFFNLCEGYWDLFGAPVRVLVVEQLDGDQSYYNITSQEKKIYDSTFERVFWTALKIVAACAFPLIPAGLFIGKLYFHMHYVNNFFSFGSSHINIPTSETDLFLETIRELRSS